MTVNVLDVFLVKKNYFGGYNIDIIKLNRNIVICMGFR